MPAPSDVIIKNAIGDVIKLALDDLYSGSNPPVNVRLHRSWVLGYDLGKSAALVRATSGRDAGKVHAWMIGLDGIKRNRMDVKGEPLSYAMTGGLRKSGPNRRDIVRTYRIWAFKQYNSGTPGSEDTNNSENELITEIEHVAKFFSRYPTLNLSDLTVQGHTELQFSGIDVYPLGETLANIARGELEVILYDSFMP